MICNYILGKLPCNQGLTYSAQSIPPLLPIPLKGALLVWVNLPSICRQRNRGPASKVSKDLTPLSAHLISNLQEWHSGPGPATGPRLLPSSVIRCHHCQHLKVPLGRTQQSVNVSAACLWNRWGREADSISPCSCWRD